MRGLLKQWFTLKWRRQDASTLREAYRVTFSTIYGQMVLQHLLDTIYCTAYEGTDPQAALVWNAKRAVVHDILMNLDMAEDPEKYQLTNLEDMHL